MLQCPGDSHWAPPSRGLPSPTSTKPPQAHNLWKIPALSLTQCSVLSFRPLHIAARNGLTAVVEELLAKGACVLAVDENGK